MKIIMANPHRWLGAKPYKVSMPCEDEVFFTLQDAKDFAKNAAIVAVVTYYGEIVGSYSPLCGWVDAG